ncbi:[protein-PII] uridylyltransferase [Thioalbus denitrificans]|uniref:Bifunctional uridylyltransferase/uridylyl-removing enzyme n=1 Tax=Thioalbus denitrificans TaxID=547122 RepID=A0A369BT38_9GAMM|nr:[protein-PII] uridylyltransferase [Thioalbus denitrificans]RCX24820.1 UTP--GlnB (protein PII) uridylyltransferase GlnD [Thioalbus denitrificans]
MEATALTDSELFDREGLESRLTGGGSPVTAFRGALKSGREVLRRRYLDGCHASELVTQQTALVDTLVVRAWRHLALADSPEVALVAVGGYGRGELFPCSDVDLLILLRGDDHDAWRDPIESFLRLLWDIGLEVGHSVRSLQDCTREAERDITIATSLMEARLLAGPEPLYRAMRAGAGPNHIWPSRKFFEAKREEQIQRHRKYHDTGYNLEPNVKGSPGGLRDIHMIGWVAKRHFGADTLYGLVEHGFLSEAEYRTLSDGQAFLWRVRFGLHLVTGRREDRLLFDHQRTLAEQFGYRDADHNLAVEQFMKRYYRTVRELRLLNELLLQLFQEAILYPDDQERPQPLNARFQLRKGFIEASSPRVFRRRPAALLEIFLLMAQHPEIKGVRAATIRLIRDHLHLIDDDFRANLASRSLFMELLRQPQGITHALRRMNSYGVLGVYIPAFGRIIGQMQYDLFHVYTVDEHTLFVLRNLRRLCVEEFTHEFPLCSELIRRIPKLELLYLGALFHDIAKGRGGDHSEIGAEEAETFCLHHGLSNYDARLVAWLVQHHLVLSVTAQRQDISDPDVINAFAAKVRDQVHLDYLYLLTVADIRGTNPTLWNSWKESLLYELYMATKRALRRGLENPIDKSDRIREVQEDARGQLLGSGLDPEEVRTFWNDQGEDYFLRYSADEIARHTQSILERGRDRTPLVLARRQTRRGGSEIFIYTHHREELFAATTSALERLGLNVVDARIITSISGFTLDAYIVLEEDGQPIQSDMRAAEIVAALEHVLSSPGDMALEVSRQIHRHLRHFRTRTEVNFYTDATNHRTVLELIAGDRPGLLAHVGRAFMEHGVRLQTAKITTLGERVEDIFFITDPQGLPFQDADRLGHLATAIRTQLDS